MILYPDDFKFNKVFRFKWETNPGDQSITFSIPSTKIGTKGLLVNSDGIPSDEITSALISKLKNTSIKIK